MEENAIEEDFSWYTDTYVLNEVEDNDVKAYVSADGLCVPGLFDLSTLAEGSLLERAVLERLEVEDLDDRMSVTGSVYGFLCS